MTGGIYMAGRKGMGHREYSVEFKAHIVEQIGRGEISIRGFARESGISRCILQQWRREGEAKSLILTKQKGKPRTRKPEENHERRIKQLEMEVELYRCFLQIVGRM